jgi:putative transposase
MHRQECLCYDYSQMTYYQRNPPHWHPPARAIFITWRLAGTLPQPLLAKLKNSTQPANRKFVLAERLLDCASFGPCWLAQPEVAATVQRSILKGAFHLAHYDLLAYVVMPNHVHFLIEPRMPLERITRGIKGTSAHLSNCILGRKGLTFWQDESFDHWIRNSAEGEKVCHYIEMNPVKAGLAKTPSDWQCSSASSVAQALLPVRVNSSNNIPT